MINADAATHNGKYQIKMKSRGVYRVGLGGLSRSPPKSYNGAASGWFTMV